MTNDQLDTAIDTAADTAALAGLDTTPELDALFAERTTRIAAAHQAMRQADAKRNRAIDKKNNELTKRNMTRWLRAAGVEPKTATWAELNCEIMNILGDRLGAGTLTQDQEIRLNDRVENWTDRY